MSDDKKTVPMTVKTGDAVHDGKGGFFAVGEKFEAADKTAAASLKDKGFAA